MRYSKLMLAVVFGALSMQMAGATPTPEEAAQLGKTLNGFGAIIAGNKEGTIPAWTGGICTPPPGYKPKNGAAGGAPYIDPYAADKPLFKVTAADVAKYADKIDEGTRELFHRFPQTFYLQVYPTRRPACYPNWMYENSIKNVMRPKIVGGSNPSVAGAQAQVPFPIPKTGVEVMWNALLKPEIPAYLIEYTNVFVDASGNRTLIDQSKARQINHYWKNSQAVLADDKPFKELASDAVFPPASVGTKYLRYQFLRPDLKGAPSWSYIPGQRRVRMSPEFAYDGVAASSGGTLIWDEMNGFDGNMDRFDFKLLGRKEMFIPYNTPGTNLESFEISTPNHLDPAAVRWELHRVWVVEATLKPGERHVQKRKMYYIDEDSWFIAIYAGMDHADKVHHLNHFFLRQEYDKPGIRFTGWLTYDLTKRVYSHWKYGGVGAVEPGYCTLIDLQPYVASAFTPEGLAGAGIR